MVTCEPITYRESTTGETFSCGDEVRITFWEGFKNKYNGLVLIGEVEYLHEDHFTLFTDEYGYSVDIDDIELMEKIKD